jgi:hypothetical protein
MSTTSLSGDQVLQAVYDPATGSLKSAVSANISGAQEVIISAIDDSIASYTKDGTGQAITSTLVSSQRGLDVAIIAGGVTGTLQPQGLSGAIKAQRVTVTDVATKIPGTALANRNSMMVRVVGTNTVYFGDLTVTAAAGYPRYEREEIFLDIQGGASTDLYAICDTGKTCVVAVFEVA